MHANGSDTSTVPGGATIEPEPVSHGGSAASRADAVAAVLEQAQTENFAVASRLLPARVRADLMALYGFARLVDDAGDEAPGDRELLLDALENELDAAYRGEATSELMRRLQGTVRAHAIPRELPGRLIEANRVDQRVARYETFDDLLGYCELSANPVGRMVLHVFDAATPERSRLSDSVCSGLQVVEHLQDVAEDFRAGRVYLPQADLRRFDCRDADLTAASAPRRLRSVIAFEAGRARRLLVAGAPLARTLPPRAAFAVAAFVSGGLAALDAISAADFDVLAATPRASRWARAGRLALTLGSLAGR